LNIYSDQATLEANVLDTSLLEAVQWQDSNSLVYLIYDARYMRTYVFNLGDKTAQPLAWSLGAHMLGKDLASDPMDAPLVINSRAINH